MNRVYNFSAGPSQMPIEVLEEARRDIFDYAGTGTSIMEMSHRSAAFEDVLEGTKETLRRILSVPEGYDILFMPGGATTQFSMVPANLLRRGETAAYAVTGRFAGLAMKEASRWCSAVEVSSSRDQNYSYIPKLTEKDIPPDAKYLHITGNNTIYGTTYNSLPEVGDIPLVADWSSAILGKEIDVSRHRLIYAGAQKNMGPAGVAVVILDRSVLADEIDELVPTMYRYTQQIESDSMYNTPPCWSIYMCGLMAKWVEKQGGVKAMEEINTEKASMLYDFIDNSKLYSNPVAREDRSIMNVTFVLPSQELTQSFLSCAQENGLINLKGHKTVGGCRASIYNGMPIEGVKKLIGIMKEFEHNVQH